MKYPKFIRDAVIREYLADQKDPVTLTNLKYAFTFQTGERCYRFDKDLNIPISRWGQLQRYLLLLVTGMQPDEMEATLNLMEEAIHEGLTKRKNATVVSALIHEIRRRFTKGAATELAYNIVAVQLVIEGEDPQVFNNETHLKKVDMLIEEEKHGDRFFFQIPEFQTLLKRFNLTESDWIKLQEQHKQEVEIYKEKLKIYTQELQQANEQTMTGKSS